MLIPEDYVPDLNVRLALYRRLSEAEKAEDREALAAELIDRFGPLPAEAEQLLQGRGDQGPLQPGLYRRSTSGPRARW